MLYRPAPKQQGGERLEDGTYRIYSGAGGLYVAVDFRLNEALSSGDGKLKDMKIYFRKEKSPGLKAADLPTDGWAAIPVSIISAKGLSTIVFSKPNRDFSGLADMPGEISSKNIIESDVLSKIFPKIQLKLLAQNFGVF